MKPFADLLERLLYTPQRTVKLALIRDYVRSVPDPDRGWGLAALTGGLELGLAKPGLIRDLITARTDPVLFAWSYDFVGDLAETAALLWQGPSSDPGSPGWPRLGEVVDGLGGTPKAALPDLLASWLDRLDATGRWALLKLVTGGLRVGASAGLAKLALAAYGRVEPAAVEEVWHTQAPPYTELFAWLDGSGPRPETADTPVFRPLMLAHPIEALDLPKVTAELDRYLAEWKWDGIRIQVVAGPRGVRLYSRAADDVSASFPEIVEAAQGLDAVLDGELLVGAPGEAGDPASFNDLQQRLNRKSVTPQMLASHPAFVRLYDLLLEGGEDLRPLPLASRRRRLEAWFAAARPPRMDLSALIPVSSAEALEGLRTGVRGTPVEGLMLKRKDSPYLAGRPKGHWWKWKRDAQLLDVVMMYAQRGHGRRSSFYSDYTFGVWRPRADAGGVRRPEANAGGTEQADGAGRELVPVGKAYSGFTDEELSALDRWVRQHTVARYGPVREVEPGLVLEVAFDAVARSTRHKSGVAMRFPRVHRIRWDKPAHEADELATLERMLG